MALTQPATVDFLTFWCGANILRRSCFWPFLFRHARVTCRRLWKFLALQYIISSPPAAWGDILQTNIFGTQRFSLTNVQTSRKRFGSWCLNQEIRWIVWNTRGNTNIEKIKKQIYKSPPPPHPPPPKKIARLDLDVGLCLRLTH